MAYGKFWEKILVGMERMKQQTVYDCADVYQLWSLIILSGSYSMSISFQFFALSNGSVWADDKILA